MQNERVTRDFTICPRCGQPTEPSISINGGESEFWRNCIKCNTYINTYVPQAHQQAVHVDPHKFILNAGGYGSGKTYTSRQEFYKHLFITPNGLTIVGANVTSQYEQTLKRDIESDLPKDFVEYISLQKSFIDFKNGHRLMFRPFDDPDKLRSLNITMFIILEASEVKGETFVQLKSRIRNLAATLPKRNKSGEILYRETKEGVLIPEIQADWRKGIIETNPDAGWPRSEVLMKSSDIQKHGRIADNYAVLEDEADPAISSHITASECNQFLPEGFIEDLKKNRPLWWVNRYIYGSFSYAEGLVYPSAMTAVCPTFEIPRHWKRIVAFDYGLADDAVYLFGAVDERQNLLYIYKEVRNSNRSVEELSQIFFQETKDIPVGGYICSPIIDPKSGPKRDYDKKSLSDHFLEYGIAFKPGHVSMDARIYRLNTYFETKRIRIMDRCTGLIKELREHKFKPKTLDDTGRSDKPMDGNDHAISALEWIVMELPANPNNLIYGIYDKRGQDITKPTRNIQKEYSMWVLQDENEESYSDYEFGGW
mgnify:FL=1